MILVGCSGFSYDDWRGALYPPRLGRARMLEAYAEVFPALEINSSYYRTPPPSTAQSLVRRAEGRLQFAVKAPGDLTHRRLLETGIVEPFRRFLEPFAAEGVLAAVLLQFPGAFQASPANEEFLARASDALRGLPLALELRHASWDARDPAPALGACRVQVDQPALPGLAASLAPRTASGGLAYLRFHGRNAGDWFSQRHPHDRYRYRYPAGEIAVLAQATLRASQGAQTTLAFFNNHPDGAAPLDAKAFAAELGLPLKGTGYRDLFS